MSQAEPGFSPSEALAVVNALQNAGVTRQSLRALSNQRLGAHLALRCAAIIDFHRPAALQLDAFAEATKYVLRHYPYAFIFLVTLPPSTSAVDPCIYGLDVRLAPPFAADRMLFPHETGMMFTSTLVTPSLTPDEIVCVLQGLFSAQVEREDDEYVPPDLRGRAAVYRISRK